MTKELESRNRLNDLFDADKFGLYYLPLSSTTIGPGPPPGKEVFKDKVTFLICTNVDGTEKIPGSVQAISPLQYH